MNDALVSKQTLIELKLGIDFGTRFTKICFRDNVQKKSWLVSFDEGNASLDEALLPTKIGISSTGQLLTGLTQSEWRIHQKDEYKFIEFIKMRLANLYPSSEQEKEKIVAFPRVDGIDLDAPVIIENLCAYYLSSIIFRAKEWIKHKYKNTLLKNKQVRWIENLGVPVEYCDSLALEPFKQILLLARLLSESHPQSLTLAQLSDRMTQCRQQIAHTTFDCETLPEISAAIQSYIAQRLLAQEGIHLFFDIGSGTLEAVSFHYKRENGLPILDFYAAKVEQLGITTLSNRLAQKSNLSAEQIEDAIVNDNDSVLKKIDFSTERLLIQQQIAEVVMEGRKSKEEARRWYKDKFYTYDHLTHSSVMVNGSKQSSFLGGGGGESEFFQNAIISTHSEFQQVHAGVPAYDEPEVLPKPEDLDMNGIKLNKFHRFAIAYGLSVQEEGTPIVKLPSRFANTSLRETKYTSSARPGEGGHSTDSECVEGVG